MNTNHDSLLEALELLRIFKNNLGPNRAALTAEDAILWDRVETLSHRMPEAAAQETPLDKLRHEMRLVTALTLKNPGVAITLPDLMATEGRKFMRGEPSLFDQLPFGEMQSVTAMLSASPAAPEGAKPEHKAMPFGERTPALMTYENQPGNVGAWRLGEACAKAAAERAGDYIDRGLVLLRELQSQGYGVVHLDAAQPPHPQPQAQPLLVRDLAEIIGKTVPEVSAVIVNLGLGNRSTNMELHPDEAIAVAKHFDQPQAQGEPIDLTIHGEGAEDGHYVRCERFREAIAKRDAALVACVEALKLAKTIIVFNQRPTGNVGATTIDAAITQANEVLGRKEGGA